MGDSDESRGSENFSDGPRTEKMEVDRPVVPRSEQTVVRRSLSGTGSTTETSSTCSMPRVSSSGDSSSVSPATPVTSGIGATDRDVTGGLLRRSNSAPMFNGPNMR